MKNLISNLFRLAFLVASVFIGFSIARKLRDGCVEPDGDLVQDEETDSVIESVETTGKSISESEVDFVEDIAIPILTFRQQKILNVLRNSQIIEMKTLQNSIKGVTERTLRRDLLELQKQGLIKKIGNTKSVKYQLITK